MPRHVAITGASSGLGAALAMAYAKRGALLSLSGRNRERLDGVAAKCAAASAIDIAPLDVLDAEATRQWLRRRDAAAPVDLVIANAGIGGDEALDRADRYGEASARILATNIMGVVNTVTPLIPVFAERRAGHIAVMSSLAAFVGLPQSPAYSASKAGVKTYGDGLRRQLAAHGVAVTVICPGFVETPMTDALPFRPRPMWTVERATEAIVRGLDRRARLVAFPRSLHLGARLGGLLPAALVDRMLARGRSWS